MWSNEKKSLLIYKPVVEWCKINWIFSLKRPPRELPRGNPANRLQWGKRAQFGLWLFGLSWSSTGLSCPPTLAGITPAFLAHTALLKVWNSAVINLYLFFFVHIFTDETLGAFSWGWAKCLTLEMLLSWGDMAKKWVWHRCISILLSKEEQVIEKPSLGNANYIHFLCNESMLYSAEYQVAFLINPPSLHACLVIWRLRFKFRFVSHWCWFLSKTMYGKYTFIFSSWCSRRETSVCCRI